MALFLLQIFLKGVIPMQEILKTNKGDIFWAELPESGRHIQTGRRPVLIVGNEKANRYSDIVTVIPITGRVEKADVIPTHVCLNTAFRCGSVLLPEQIRTISKDQLLGSCIYRLTEDEQKTVDRALSEQLGFI